MPSNGHVDLVGREVAAKELLAVEEDPMATGTRKVPHATHSVPDAVLARICSGSLQQKLRQLVCKIMHDPPIPLRPC